MEKIEYLEDLCITGGCLNAYKAVRAATEPQTFTGDVNGDGRDDFIVKWKKDDNNCFLTYTGALSGTFNSAVRIVPSVAVPYYNEK